jgi:hypothetical protein
MKRIPESHLELIDGPYTVALSTVMPDGQPQTTPVWCNRKSDCIFINVMKGFRKEKNMRLNPKVSLLVYNPKNPLHNIEIRGLVIEMTEDDAVEHLDELTRLYLGEPDAKFLEIPFLRNCNRAIHPCVSRYPRPIFGWKVEEECKSPYQTHIVIYSRNRFMVC